MAWWGWYPPTYSYPYWGVPDPTYLMWATYSWMASYYYMMLYVETYKAFLETWKKTFESLTKAYEAVKPAQ